MRGHGNALSLLTIFSALATGKTPRVYDLDHNENRTISDGVLKKRINHKKKRREMAIISRRKNRRAGR